MLTKPFRIAFFCALILTFSSNAKSQSKNLAEKTLSVSKNASVIIVGSTAKLGYKATKFSAGKMVKPIIVKTVPAVGKFGLNQTNNAIKTTFPLGKKLFVKYVKYKIFP